MLKNLAVMENKKYYNRRINEDKFRNDKC